MIPMPALTPFFLKTRMGANDKKTRISKTPKFLTVSLLFNKWIITALIVKIKVFSLFFLINFYSKLYKHLISNII